MRRDRKLSVQEEGPVCYVSCWVASEDADQLKRKSKRDGDIFSLITYEPCAIDCVFVNVHVMSRFSYLNDKKVKIWLDRHPANGLFVMYCVGRRQEFESAQAYLKKTRSAIKKHGMAVWVVGVIMEKDRERQVSEEDGKALAEAYDAVFSEMKDEDVIIVDMLYEMVRLGTASNVQ